MTYYTGEQIFFVECERERHHIRGKLGAGSPKIMTILFPYVAFSKSVGYADFRPIKILVRKKFK